MKITSPAVLTLFLLNLLLAFPLLADISGTVVDGGGSPIAGATVILQATLNSPIATTAGDGTFTLVLPDPGAVKLGIAVEYDPDAATNWATDAVDATNPSTGVTITLEEIPSVTDINYDPPGVSTCGTCHSDIVTEWSDSVHSTAAEDFWVRDLYSGDGSPGGGEGYVFLDTHDPDDTGTCATCHAPMADAFDPGNVFLNDAYDSGDPAALDGVSCLACHQLHRVDGDPNAIHTLGNSQYRFPDGSVPTERYVWGPLADVENRFMRANYAPHFKSSRLCGSCHQYLAPIGQTTYEEWLESPFSVPGPSFQTCQDCHMPPPDEDGTICNFGPPPVRPGEQRRSHAFVGSTPQTLADNIDLAVDLTQTPGEIRVRASVTNFGAGHDFPTGVSIRNALLVVSARVNGAAMTQIDGPRVPVWADDDVPGKQPGDYAGEPGTGYAKILEGRINGQGDLISPVLFVDAERVRTKTTIASGTTDVSDLVFQIPSDAQIGDPLQIEARLIYRRATRALYVTKGWTTTPQGGPIEIDVATQTLDVTLQVPADPLAIPVLHPVGLALMTALLALSMLVIYRRKQETRS